MAVISTGPIDNSPVSKLGSAQQVTIKLANRDFANFSTILIQGYYLTSIRSLYVLEELTIGPNAAISRNYATNVPGYEFVFTTSGPAQGNIEISVWGKSAEGEILSVQRVVSGE
ncbi:hypothetical protein [Paenibacillus glycinis]|uniref:Uncharacterized protein n=1 Tax=Paenibacillus glycinis TaxID=2697035 RepID=A0ABW9XX79_9BACL|nr:hypothetical protein [Paenibacillus glycinis]NBD27305.1 hypothetical protein [Paenibacillus glycinis]